jgi:hypothetical protein
MSGCSTDSDWKIRNPDGAHVAHEQATIEYDPIVVKDFEQALLAAHKIVGVSDDHALLARVETEMQAALGDAATAARSQAYYLDITHPLANKGAGVRRLAALMGVPMERDRGDRRRSQRRRHVRAGRLQHRHGQCQRRGEEAGALRHRPRTTKTASPPPSRNTCWEVRP